MATVTINGEAYEFRSFSEMTFEEKIEIIKKYINIQIERREQNDKH
jgi:hypothetical protein